MDKHLPAGAIIEVTGIKKSTFFQRVKLRRIKKKILFGKRHFYSISDWNNKCPDMIIH